MFPSVVPVDPEVTMLRTIILVSVVYSLSACAMGEQPRGTLSDAVEDSAGVQIITHGLRTTTNVPAVQAIEELRIGSVDGPAETQFGFVSTIHLADDGTIWMYDPRNYRISVFDARGGFVRSFGRRGTGPGEFSGSVTGFAVLRDTVVVLELNRAHTFDRQGNLLQTQLTEGADVLRVSTPVPTPAGLLVFAQERVDRGGARGGPFRDTTSVRLFDPATAQVGEVVHHFANTPYFLFGSSGWLMRPLFQAESRYGVMHNGRLFYSDGAEYAIDFYDSTGSLMRRIRAEVERIPVTDADMREYIQRELAEERGGSEGIEFRKAFEQHAEGVGHAEYRPIVGRIIGADNGGFMVERLDLDTEPFNFDDDTTWDVFDAEGRITGRLTLAERITARRFTGTHLYAVARDGDDVQYIVRYRIR
jgi:hypothetical protein